MKMGAKLQNYKTTKIEIYIYIYIVAYATGRNDTEVYRSYFIYSVNQVKLQYINTQSSMSDIIMNNTGIGIIKIRMIIFNLFYATIMQLTSIPAL